MQRFEHATTGHQGDQTSIETMERAGWELVAVVQTVRVSSTSWAEAGRVILYWKRPVQEPVS